MENLNAEYIKVALKCHSDPKNKCEICPYNKKCCSMALSNDALALINSQEQRIKELSEENERLSKEVADLQDELKCEKETNNHLCDEYMSAKADTVREMQERFKAEMRNTAKYSFGGREYSVIGEAFIDQIAQEMVEGINGIQDK